MKVGQYNLCIFSDPDGLMIPYLTICPLPGFRKRGFFYSNADFLPTYLHSYRPTYLHSYRPTYLHSYLHSYLPTFIPTYLHSYLPTFIPTYPPTFLPIFIPTYLHSYLPLLTLLKSYLPTWSSLVSMT